MRRGTLSLRPTLKKAVFAPPIPRSSYTYRNPGVSLALRPLSIVVRSKACVCAPSARGTNAAKSTHVPAPPAAARQ